MRFHLDGVDEAEQFEQVLGGPFLYKVTDATEYDWGIQMECTVQEGKFAGKFVFHSISPSEKSLPYVKQFLAAANYEGNIDTELDIETADLLNLEFVAMARQQKNNKQYSQLYNFKPADEYDG